MDEERFAEEHGRLVKNLSKTKGACPDSGLLLAYHEGELNVEQKAALEKHVALCAICQELLQRISEERAPVDDLGWKRVEKRLDQRASPWRASRKLSSFAFGWRSLAAVAAMLVVTLAAVVWLATEHGVEAPSTSSPTRGTTIQVIAPAGVVERIDRFEWNAPPLEVTFHLQIKQQEELIWEGRTSSTYYSPPPDLLDRLKPGASYRWKVRGVNAQGETLVDSDWTNFQLEN